MFGDEDPGNLSLGPRNLLGPRSVRPGVTAPIPFERVGHLLVVPVNLGQGLDSRFILDTGIGVNLVSRSLAAAAGLVPTPEIARGRRMSGQEIAMPVERLPYLRLGERTWTDLSVSTLDMEGFHPMLRDLGGFLSLGPFQDLPFTLDYARQLLELHEGEDRRYREAPGYAEVPLYAVWEGPAVSVQMDLELPEGSRARVEVDTGSEDLILHERYMERLRVTPGQPAVRTVEGRDETGHAYTRHFARVAGEVRTSGAPTIGHSDLNIMFQRIIYDGLVGDAFLKRFNVTIDLPSSRIGFTPHPG